MKGGCNYIKAYTLGIGLLSDQGQVSAGALTCRPRACPGPPRSRGPSKILQIFVSRPHYHFGKVDVIIDYYRFPGGKYEKRE